MSASKPVSKCSMDGAHIETFPSIDAACRAVDGYRNWIRAVANAKPLKNTKGSLYIPRSYLGFKWRWAN